MSAVNLNNIGNTPLIKLNRIAEPDGAEIYVKYEGGNPTGSMKDDLFHVMSLVGPVRMHHYNF